MIEAEVLTIEMEKDFWDAGQFQHMCLLSKFCGGNGLFAKNVMRRYIMERMMEETYEHLTGEPSRLKGRRLVREGRRR
jgi:hypothetical protein